MSGYLFDVFLSYKSENSAWVETLKQALEERGARVWKDKEQIRPGDHFPNAILDGMRSSKAVVMVITPESQEKKWIVWEYARAKELAEANRVHLIPVLALGADNTDFATQNPEDLLPEGLKHIHYLDMRSAGGFQQKVDSILWPGITGKTIDAILVMPSETEAWTKFYHFGKHEGMSFHKGGDLSRASQWISGYLAPSATRLVVIVDPFEENASAHRYNSPKEYIDYVFDLRDKTRDTPYEVVFVLYSQPDARELLQSMVTPDRAMKLPHYFLIPRDPEGIRMLGRNLRQIWNKVQWDLMKAERNA